MKTDPPYTRKPPGHNSGMMNKKGGKAKAFPPKLTFFRDSYEWLKRTGLSEEDEESRKN